MRLVARPLCSLSPCRLPCARVEALAAGAAGGAGVRKRKQSPWLVVFKTLNASRVKGAHWVYHKSDHAIDDCLRHLGCLESTVGSLALKEATQAPLGATSFAFVQDVAQTAVRPVHRMDDDVRVAVVGIHGRAKVPQGGRKSRKAGGLKPLERPRGLEDAVRFQKQRLRPSGFEQSAM